MKKVRLLSILLVIVSLFTMFGASVQAAASSNSADNKVAVQNLYDRMVQAKGQDFDKFFAQLSPADQKLAIKILTPTSVEAERGPSPLDYSSGLNTTLT